MPRAAGLSLLLPLIASLHACAADRPADDALVRDSAGITIVENGRMRGLVDLPAPFRPLHIEGDTVFGVFRDDLDVEYIRGYTTGVSPAES